MSAPETLYILDGSYYIFRAFYALRSLSNSKGMPTNGLYAFTRMLLNVIRDERPEHLIVTFDPPGKTFRHEMYEAYKANRESPPDELRAQMPHFRRIVKALNIPVIEVPGFEADDVIGTIVRSKTREGVNVVVLTGDKDLYQLVDEQTTLVDSMRDKKIGIPEVIERFQVGPEGVAAVLALAGDTSDNVPGVPGIGEKTAGKLMEEFGTLENLLANIEAVSGKKRKENLTNFADQARLSLELVTIKTDVPFALTREQMELEAPDFEAFDRLCAEFEFRTFPEVLREIFPDSAEEHAIERVVEAQYRTIRTHEELYALVQELHTLKRFALDLETTSLNPLDARIVGISISTAPHTAVYIPVGHRYPSGNEQLGLGELFDGEETHASNDLVEDQLPIADVLNALRPIVEDENYEMIAHNGGYEMRVFSNYNIALHAFRFDTLLASFLVEPNRRRHGLDPLAISLLGQSALTFEDVAGRGKNQVTFDYVEIERATQYACEDADFTLQLADLFTEQLKDLGMLQMLYEVEVPLAKVLARMEQEGVTVDTAFLRDLSVEFGDKLERLEEEIYAAAGEEFLISSPKQLAVVLFESLNLPVIKRTKTGPSTDQSVLEELADEHPLPRLILAYRHFAKLKSTYVDALPQLVHAKTGRVHTHFNQAVVPTGRLSSSDPNLQNIPVRSEDGRRIRRAFVPREGWVLLGGDYSQVELRVLAHASEDPVLIEAFVNGEDIHRRTAAEIFGLEQAEVTSAQREAAKIINFGLVYGMGVRRLAKEIDVSMAEAQTYMDQYFERLPRVKPFFDAVIEQARNEGFIETLGGRKRAISGITSDNRRISAQAERVAMNAPIQGGAADLIKVAMLRIAERIEEEKLQAKLLIQVHDELLFEAPPEEVDRLEQIARQEMENVRALRVPLKVDFVRGQSWADLE